MINGLSDDNVSFLIEIINRLMPQNDKVDADAIRMEDGTRRMRAFQRLDAARSEIRQYLPDDFDPERELEEVRVERYGSLD